jgi:hypothetical protein
LNVLEIFKKKENEKETKKQEKETKKKEKK